MILTVLGRLMLAFCLFLFGWALLALFWGFVTDFVEKHMRDGDQ